MRFFIVVCRPLPCRVRSHGRSQNLIKMRFLCSEGRWYGVFRPTLLSVSCLWPPFFSRTVCKIYSDKRLIKFGVNVPERWFRYPQSYSSALPFQWIGMSCTINTTMDRRILGIFSSTLLSKVHL